MSRDNFDIPEVFRRAMEEAGWDDEGKRGGGDDGGKRPPFPRRPNQSRRPNRLFWIIAIVIALLLSVNFIVTTFTEWLWFTELSYESVWLKQWGLRVLSFVIAFIVAAVVLLLNWHLAKRRAIKATPPFNPKFLQIRGVSWIITGLGLFLSFGFATSMGARWEQFLRYYYRTPFGTADPIFGRDVSFYLFELPVYEGLQQWILSLLVLTLLGVVAIYAVNNIIEIQRGQWRPQESRVLRQHVALLGAIILGLWAVGYLFEVFNLVYSDRGVVFGASYTDINASLYAYYAQMAFMILAAIAVLINVFRLSFRPLLAAGGLWLAATLLLGGLYPSLLQRYSVTPNEIVRESPYIEHNINFTRMAFGLDNIDQQTHVVGDPLNQQDMNDNEAVLSNIRLWDYRPLQDTYTQLQSLRTYYQFGEIDIDRYNLDGQVHQVMLAARELNKSQLPFSSWVNLHLEYTHGYGLVMNPVDQFTADGQPEFFIQDLPPKSNIDLEVTRPEIYYGEMTDDVVFVGSEREEFSYPRGNDNVYSSYEGTGGVPLDSYLKRLAFAYRLGDANVLLSNEINTSTRIQFHRQIQNRIRQITPFLQLDRDPYIVLVNGRLVWIQDAFTTSSLFPYSERLIYNNRPINYIRNSVKVTVDAYDGTVNYYIADEQDPLIQAYNRAFPDLFQPFSAMPEALQAHVRYPEDLFLVQREQYRRYHMTDVRVFYNQEDVWQIPQEIFSGDQQEMEPYYVIMSLPGEPEAEFLLIQPYTPANKPNMVAWLAARNDPDHYGELIVYELPKQELVFGPMQVESRIDQEPTISEQFSLWNQGGSNVIRGNLLVLPINQSFLYVEPVYLLADTGALPELKRVIVATDSRIAMETTLDRALSALLLEEPGEIVVEEGAIDVAETGDGGGIEVEAEPLAGDLDASVTDLIQSANDHFVAAEQAQQNGDWATYGVELNALESDLQRLVEMTGE